VATNRCRQQTGGAWLASNQQVIKAIAVNIPAVLTEVLEGHARQCLEWQSRCCRRAQPG